MVLVKTKKRQPLSSFKYNFHVNLLVDVFVSSKREQHNEEGCFCFF